MQIKLHGMGAAARYVAQETRSRGNQSGWRTSEPSECHRSTSNASRKPFVGLFVGEPVTTYVMFQQQGNYIIDYTSPLAFTVRSRPRRLEGN